VGVVRIRLHLPDNHSLKGKRKVIKSIIGQVSSRFNVAVSEVADHDLWQVAEIGVSAVGNSEQVINSVLDKVVNFIDRTFPGEMIQSDMDIIHMGR